MSLFPPEPDPSTAIPCPHCGDPISPEGAKFLIDSERELPNTARMTTTPADQYDQDIAAEARRETDEEPKETDQEREDRHQEDRGDLMREDASE